MMMVCDHEYGTMMMVVGDHEYEYDDDTSDARGEHFCVTVS
jgi:hypothetical protein